MTTAWPILGIAPTQDLAAIRRAYAEKLRAIDPDRQPDAFMALRAAFTQAQNLATRRPQPLTSSPPDIIAAPKPDPAALAEEARLREAERLFAEAEQAGATAPAYAAYKHCRALGAGAALGNAIAPLTLRMALIAARDTAIELSRADEILQELGLDAMALDRHKSNPQIIELSNILNRRLAAELWLQSLEHLAAIKWYSKQARAQRYQIRVARFILGQQRSSYAVENSRLLRELARFDHHRLYLAHRLDGPRLDRARLRAQKITDRLSRITKRQIYIVVFFVVLVIAILRTIFDPTPN